MTQGSFKLMILARLDQCSHTPDYAWEYRPLEGDAVYCYRCNRSRTCVGYIEQYTVVCGNCAYTRRKGVAKLSAEIDASKHQRKNPSHKIKLYLGRQVEHTWYPQAEKLDFSFTESGENDYPF